MKACTDDRIGLLDELTTITDDRADQRYGWSSIRDGQGPVGEVDCAACVVVQLDPSSLDEMAVPIDAISLMAMSNGSADL